MPAIIFAQMWPTFDNINQVFADLEFSLREFFKTHLQPYYPWNEKTMPANLQQVYQVCYEGLCIYFKIDRLEFGDYDNKLCQSNHIPDEKLPEQIDAIRWTWASSEMFAWRELNDKERSAMIFLEQCYTYICAYHFDNDLANVHQIGEDYIDSFRNTGP